jgi:oligo-1,6-glucosidase
VLDLVVNHTSDEHAWFVESRSSQEGPRRDFYIWRPGRDGGPPDDWPSFFGGPAWKRDDTTGDWYLHLFAEKQPDLNWENPEVRREVHDLMRFWLDRGVDGFRMDVIASIAKPEGLPDLPPAFAGRPQYFYAAQPRYHEFMQATRREVMDGRDVMTVGEAFGVTLEQTPAMIDERCGELDMIFHFDVVRIDSDGWRAKPWTLPQLKAIYGRFDRGLDAHCWPTVFISNHDNPRPVSHFGDDRPAFREASAKLLGMLVLTMKGTPFIYQGDELGMTNYPFASIGDFDDVEVKGTWRAEVLTGRVDSAEYLANLLRTSRDHSRTPIQWDWSPNAGFTTAENPWFAVNPNYPEINAARAVADPNSVYHWYRRLIALRREHPALVYGDYADLDPDHPQVFAYTRRLGAEHLLVMLNWASESIDYTLPSPTAPKRLLIGNADPEAEAGPELSLAPWEARLYVL